MFGLMFKKCLKRSFVRSIKEEWLIDCEKLNKNI